ncbi:hypothetical protein GFY24_09215 [Nocardia sp. SYP-A9097]|uniref:Acg family FMN-binding oxidoreductase n=1 Tax=Nocardia sp. SYP-A9097 TaxID=2663237 RepID=UPI00129AFB8E|nr:hypothetical protein [Nocardia sp. SYP-A9097]MRH87630.1 hypothetical protein [Nocardia sp. SYP-A9097]
MTAMNVPPVAGPDHRTMLAALRLASRAPSVHNTQPWRWVLCGDALHLYTDTDRLLTVADPQARQLIISCGAMLHHARTAFGAHGWHTDTNRLPDPEQPNLLAEIRFRPWPTPPAALVARAGAIDCRRTDRLPMDAPKNWDAVLPHLRMLVSPHYLELLTLDDDARTRLIAASRQATALRQHDIEYQSEIGWWTGHSETFEGVPQDALISDAESARVPVGRTFPAAPHSARRPESEDRAALLVLCSETDSLIDWLRTGEALSAVLLECAVAELATCTLTHITELPTGRALLANLVRPTYRPQILLRIGTAPDGERKPPPTPRRPLNEILTIER